MHSRKTVTENHQKHACVLADWALSRNRQNRKHQYFVILWAVSPPKTMTGAQMSGSKIAYIAFTHETYNITNLLYFLTHTHFDLYLMLGPEKQTLMMLPPPPQDPHWVLQARRQEHPDFGCSWLGPPGMSPRTPWWVLDEPCKNTVHVVETTNGPGRMCGALTWITNSSTSMEITEHVLNIDEHVWTSIKHL